MFSQLEDAQLKKSVAKDSTFTCRCNYVVDRGVTYRSMRAVAIDSLFVYVVASSQNDCYAIPRFMMLV